MRYNINASLIYDAKDGTLTLVGNSEPNSQLSITASAFFYFFLRSSGIVSRDEVLKKVWDDSGLTSSNSNLNQYLSILRKTFRHYGIDNIIVSVSRGHLQLNPDVAIEILDTDLIPQPEVIQKEVSEPEFSEGRVSITESVATSLHSRDKYWYIAGIGLLAFSFLLIIFQQFEHVKPRPLDLTSITHSQCELLASDEMLNSVTTARYTENFDRVRERLKLTCKPGERFVFFYGDRLQTNGLGRVFMAHCAMHENNAFSYCDNYFYYSWNVQ